MLQTVVERLDRQGLITRISLDDGRERAVVTLRNSPNESFGILRNGSGSIDEPVCSQAHARLLSLTNDCATVREAVFGWIGDYRDKD